MKRLIAWTAAVFLALGVSIAGAQTLVPITLDGSKSFDPDGDTITYEWSEDGQVLATGVKPEINFAPGMHIITLEVCDPAGLCDTDNVMINVNEPNRAPVANAGPDQVAQIIQRGSVNVALNGAASQGDDLSYRWTLRDKIVGATSQPVVRLVQGSHLIWLDVKNDAGADSDYLIVTVAKKRS